MEKIRKILNLIREDPLLRIAALTTFQVFFFLFAFGLGYMSSGLHYRPMLKDCEENQQEWKQLDKDRKKLMLDVQRLKNEERIFKEQMFNIIEYNALSDSLQEKIITAPKYNISLFHMNNPLSKHADIFEYFSLVVFFKDGEKIGEIKLKEGLQNVEFIGDVKECRKIFYYYMNPGLMESESRVSDQD